MNGISLVTVTFAVVITGAALWKYQSKKNRLSNHRYNLQRILCYGREDVKIVLIETIEDWVKVSKTVINDICESGMIGLDVEWYNNGKIALMQLALTNGLCLLVRLNRLKCIPDGLLRILQDQKILKIGVGIQEDCAKILIDYQCTCRNWMDIRHLVRSRRQHCTRLGMAGIAQEVLSLTLDKDWRIRAGDWEEGFNKDGKLSPRQIEYASNDALVALNVAIHLRIDDIDNRYWLWTLPTNSDSFQDVVLGSKEICQFYAEKKFKYKPTSTKNVRNDRNKSCPRKIDPTRARHRNAIRKEPLYHNVRLEAPDGQQLCVTDQKKAKWYVLKGLGEYIENETAVRLKFEPAGRPEGAAGDYYLADKCNQCVVCGKDESYLRKYIVPHEYRKYFPEVMRDHQSHDVLLMCVHCHQKSNLHDLDIRQHLEKICDAPLGTKEDVKVYFDSDLKAVRSAAKALLNNKGNIPSARVTELKHVLSSYYGIIDVDEELCKRGMNLESNILNENYVPHGKKVVEYFISSGDGILHLEKIWRQHFLDTMKPKYLPPFWSVSHQEQRLEIRLAEKRIDLEDYKIAIGHKKAAEIDL